MRYWLMKSEPAEFSIDDLVAAPKQTTGWFGVRNYQARNFIRDGMKKGDLAFLYHSGCEEPAIAGIMEICRKAYPDPTQFDRKSDYYDEKSTREEPRWSLVDVKFERRFAEPITLEEIKRHADALGEEFALIKRGSRLSVLPVTAAQWKTLLKLEKKR